MDTKLCAASSQKALREINVHLLQQITSKLKLHWQREAHLDFAALQDVSDSAQDRCLLVLRQLEHKLSTSSHAENLTPPPLNASHNHSDRPLPAPPSDEPPMDQKGWGMDFITPKPLTPPYSPPSERALGGLDWNPESTFAPPNTMLTHRPSPSSTKAVKSVPLVSAISGKMLAQQHRNEHGQVQHDASQILSTPAAPSHDRSGSGGSDDSGGRSLRLESSAGQYKPLATTTEKVSFFGIRKKRVEMVPDMPENPLVDKYLNEAIEDEASSLHRGSLATNATGKTRDIEEISFFSSTTDPDDDTNSILTATSTMSLERRDSVTPVPSHKSKRSKAELELLASSRPLASINARDLLPNELNNYSGFCKGAWRQQIGDSRRAMEERVKPGSMYNTTKYWQCRHCKFEGRYVPPKNKGERGYDTRIAKLTEGIQFRWEFLFKSHIASTNMPVTDPSKGTYGCMFCCAEGIDSPVFDGIVNFVRHLVEHRDRLPTGEVLYRMNCLVGKQATANEDFDVNIMSREGGIF